jgi:hypothetical protein
MTDETTENIIWDILCSGWDSNRSYGEPLTFTGWIHCLLVQSVLTPGDILEFGISKITVFISVTPCTQKYLEAWRNSF